MSATDGDADRLQELRILHDYFRWWLWSCCVAACVNSGGETSEKVGAWVVDVFWQTISTRSGNCPSELPKTRKGKLIRRVGRDVLNGFPQRDMPSLANPEILDELQVSLNASVEGKKGCS